MPSVADMATGEQQQEVDTSPEAQVEADAGQAGGQAADQTAGSLQGDAVPIPRPKPEGVVPTTTTTVAEAAPETAVADVLLDLKPGSVIKGTNGLIPIPVPKPQAP